MRVRIEYTNSWIGKRVHKSFDITVEPEPLKGEKDGNERQTRLEALGAAAAGAWDSGGRPFRTR